MKVLALDSATERLAIALVETLDDATAATPPRFVEARDLEGGPAASRLALPALLALLADAAWTPADLHAIAFGQGPGGFTGLRTACSVAQGLACGLGLPVLPIDSLMIVAEAARADHAGALAGGGLAWAAMDARMDEIYAAAYAWDEAAGWSTVVAPALTDPAALATAWASRRPALVAGSAVTAFADRLPLAGLVTSPAESGRAAALARLAARAAARGEGVPADQALPVYLRDKVALTTREREASKGGVK